MSKTFRTTLRLDLGKPASAQAAVLLRQLHAERGVAKPAFKEVYKTVKSFIKDVLPREKHLDMER